MAPYGYLRKSRVVDLSTSFGPETQEREIRALAARFGDNGGRLVLLADWDISGDAKHTQKRTAYQELVRAIDDGRCSAVYSYSLSRLARSVSEASHCSRPGSTGDMTTISDADSINERTSGGSSCSGSRRSTA